MFLQLLFIVISVNAFPRLTTLLQKKVLFCNKEDDNDEKKPTKISIKSVTDLFNRYLEEENKSVAINEVIPSTYKQKVIIDEKPFYPPDTPIRGIHRALMEKRLLDILQNDATGVVVKLAYLRENKWLFDEPITDIRNGGLMKEWDTLF